MTSLRAELAPLDAVTAARRLLGATLTRQLGAQTVTARIVETETYHQADAASHSYRGRTPRSEVMFGLAGHAYIYFTYGMHFCYNVVVGEPDYGAAVLIRAVEPLTGEHAMRELRDKPGVALTNGPAKLCQALALDTSLNGHDLARAPLQLTLAPPIDDSFITQTTRIGISQAVDEPWRFYLTGNPYVSRP